MMQNNLKLIRFYFPKCIIKNCNAIINGTKFYDQAIDSTMKRYEESRTEQGEDCTTACLLNYEHKKIL